MLRQILFASGLVFMPFACSDDQEETEEAIEMPDGDVTSDSGPAVPDGSDPMGDATGTDDAVGGGMANVDPGSSIPDGNPAANNPGSVGNPGSMGEGEGEGASMGAGGQYPSMFVRCAVLRIRQGPGTSYPTVGYVTFNTQIIPQELNSKWVKIGANKYVGRHYLSSHKNNKQYIPAH